MKIKKSEVLNINAVLNSLTGAYNPKVKYWLAKNKKLLAGEVASLEEAEKSNSELYNAYDKELGEIVRDCIEMGVDGRPVKQGSGYRLKEDKVEFYRTETKRLSELHAVGIAEREVELKLYEALLSETVEVGVYQLNSDDVPEEINQARYDVIFDLIKGDE